MKLASCGAFARSPLSFSALPAARGSVQNTVNQAGQEITKRNLNVQPTLTIRPGVPLNVMVSKDLTLRPYQPLFFLRGASP